MGAPAKKRATYQDVLNAPEHMVAEIIQGELVLVPRPASPHARASSRLGAALDDPFDHDGDGRGPGGWIFLDEPELHLSDGDVIVPDLAGWRRSRMPRVPDVPFLGPELLPDWVCEVLSPGSVARDRVQKMALYAREGIAYVWLIDPIARTLEVFGRRSPVSWATVGAWRDDEHVRDAPPFEELALDLTRLWR